MKSNLSPAYIKYKVFFMIAAFDQRISKNLVKSFITVNDTGYYKYPDEVFIKIERIDGIACEVLELIHGKYYESDS